jgi:hypothetical protein
MGGKRTRPLTRQQGRRPVGEQRSIGDFRPIVARLISGTKRSGAFSADRSQSPHLTRRRAAHFSRTRRSSGGIRPSGTDFYRIGDIPVVNYNFKNGWYLTSNFIITANLELRAIGRQAILNSFQHAHAGRVDVSLTYHRRGFSMSISDDGAGIDTDVLAGGRRAGHFGVGTVPECGSVQPLATRPKAGVADAAVR